MLSVNQNGEMVMAIDFSEIAKLLEISREDFERIYYGFHQWAGYLPEQSRRKEKDFHIFVRYAITDNALRLKAAFLLDVLMFEQLER